MGVLHCSLGHVTLFLCKYNFMVHFQLFHYEWQAGLSLGSGSRAKHRRESEAGGGRVAQWEQEPK